LPDMCISMCYIIQ